MKDPLRQAIIIGEHDLLGIDPEALAEASGAAVPVSPPVAAPERV